MASLLQTLLIETLPEDTDPILSGYIEKILPAIEREFSPISALGGTYDTHLEQLQKIGDKYAAEKAQRYSGKPDQNLCVHVLNALLIAWNLAEATLNPGLSEEEKYLLCLGITLHDYNKYCNGQGEEAPKAFEVSEILALCVEMGNVLNFSDFWPVWRQYISEIGWLAQNTQFNAGANAFTSNWPQFRIKDPRRLKSTLQHLLAFADIAVHLTNPADIVSTTKGDRLRERLRSLHPKKTLVYHRLRDTLGVLTNGIHNATLHFTKELGWQPIAFFAQGVVYLVPKNTDTPELAELQEAIWEAISQTLADKMLLGDIGFKRDGKGLKIAPQTLELFSPSQLIRELPTVIESQVKNAKNPATPKRLDKLVSQGKLTAEDRESLDRGADLRSDRLAEFILIVQREFLPNCPEYIDWILETLELSNVLNPEDTQVVMGGVNYGWYRVAAAYVANHKSLDESEMSDRLSELAAKLADWATENNYLPPHQSPTREIFNRYLEHYLDISGWETKVPSFEQELSAYIAAKTKAAKQPICSLSSGEFPSEDQMDSVVLFKPQQYSNKNTLGGGQIKRGISKIWALEMLLRQALWSAKAGKFEDQHPVFLYIFPAYVYAPQSIRAVGVLVKTLSKLNLWEVRKQWLDAEMKVSGLQDCKWLEHDPEAGRFDTEQYRDKYNVKDLPFMATVYTTTRGKTVTDAWVKPAFLALAFPLLLGVRVVATTSNFPLYNSDADFPASTVLDGPAGFWSLLQSSTAIRVQELVPNLTRLLLIYTLHLDNRSNAPDARWNALNSTVREVMTDVLNVFAIAQEGLRRSKREHPSKEEVKRYWQFAQILAKGNAKMEEKLKFTKKLVQEYRKFYQVSTKDSSHSILLPLSKALEVILSVPDDWDDEELIFQGAGQLQAALDRQEVYKRPLIKDTSIAYETRTSQELQAIHTFMTTCVKEVFGDMCKGDRALLQENRNRIKSGAEFAYRWLALQEKAEEKI